MAELPAILRGLSLGTVSGWVLVAAVVLALVKAWPALKKLQVEEDGSLRSDLMARITKLEDELAVERKSCAELIAEMRRDYEARLAAQGRQIDDLQREIYNLRRTALRMIERADPNSLASMALRIDDEESGG